MVRNISAHNDRLFCFRSKCYLSFKDIDKKYKQNDNETNLYMIMASMKSFLNDEYNILLKYFIAEINILKEHLSSVNIEDILNIMGFPTNKIDLNGI